MFVSSTQTLASTNDLFDARWTKVLVHNGISRYLCLSGYLDLARAVYPVMLALVGIVFFSVLCVASAGFNNDLALQSSAYSDAGRTIEALIYMDLC